MNIFLQYKKTSVFTLILIITFGWMIYSGTLSYTLILVQRQTQLLRTCVYPNTHFFTTAFASQFNVPKGFCILPHRIFPADTSIQVVPRGWYNVISEYSKGTIAQESVASIQFEPTSLGRTAVSIEDALQTGGFMNHATTSTYINPAGWQVLEIRGVTSILDNSTYNWAFLTHPNGQILVSIVVPANKDQTVLHTIVNTFTVHK
jgi:hypothetical protein